VFRVGEKDSEFLQTMFQPEFEAPDIMHLDNYNGYLRLLVKGKPVKAFNIETIPPEPTNFERVEFLKQQSYERYGRPREEVEAQINARYAPEAPSPERLQRDVFGAF
jgi:hypothetical protein